MVTKKVARAIWKWGPEVAYFLTDSKGKVIGYLRHNGESVAVSRGLGKDFRELMPHIPLKSYDEFDEERYRKQFPLKWRDKE